MEKENHIFDAGFETWPLLADRFWQFSFFALGRHFRIFNDSNFVQFRYMFFFLFSSRCWM